MVTGCMVTAALLRHGHSAVGKARAVSSGPGRARSDRPLRTGALTRRLAEALDRAEVGLSPRDALAWWLATGIGAFALGAVVSPDFGVLASLAIVAGGPIAVALRRDRLQRRLIAETPRILERVASGLRAGASPARALERAAQDPGVVGRELDRVWSRVRLGLSLREALAAWSAERDISEVRTVATGLEVATVTGGRAVPALEGLAEALRAEQAVQAEARVQGAQGRLSALVIGSLPVASLGASVLLERESLTVLLTHDLGRISLVLGLGLQVAGVWWMRRIIGGMG